MATSRSVPDFSFVHAADLHLDTPFKGIGATAPFVGEQLREASLEAFDALVETCFEHEAAFLVVAGDIYDGPERGLRAQLRFRDGLARLSDSGISSFIVHGNHDPVETGWSALGGAWPDRVTVFGSDEVGAVTVERDGAPLATVQGISYGQRREQRNLALRFRAAAGPGLQVGVLHCNVQGAASGYDDYSPCSLADLRSAGIDYWALGHIHSRLVLSGATGSAEPWVVYPGNLQARSPKPSERGPKGSTVVRVAAGRVVAADPVACDRIRFDAVEVDAGGIDDLGELRGELANAALDRLGGAQGRSIVVRGRVVGRSGLAGDLRRPGVLADLLTTLREDFSQAAPFCWWDALEDASASRIDLEVVRAGSDFASDLVAMADRLRDQLVAGEGSVEALASELADGLPGAARRADLLGHLTGDGSDQDDDLVGRALSLALGELERDGA
jgi:exonuclease SbcD